MNDFLGFLFSVERYTSSSRREQARLLYILTAIVVLADVLLVFVIPTTPEGTTSFLSGLRSGDYSGIIAGSGLVIGALITSGLVRNGFYTAGAWLLNVAVMFASLNSSLTDGLVTDTSYIALAFVVLLSALTLQEAGLIVAAAISTVIYMLSFFTSGSDSAITVTGTGFGAFLALEVMVYAFIRYARASRTEGQSVEGEERLRAARINTRITSMAAERVSLQDALNTTLDVILESYPRFYHAQVFLIDNDGVQARLSASTGNIGQQLLARGHSLPVGSLSVIGQVTFKGEPVIARSADENTLHRENILLAQTRLEAAFPLRIGDKTIGALDLQSTDDTELTEYDTLTYLSLANSLSLAIDNIRQFEAAIARVEENQLLAEQARTALREVERLNQRLIGRAWSEYLSGRDAKMGLNIDFENNSIEPDTVWTPTLANAARSNAIVQDGQIIAVPLRVRGMVIGAMEFELGSGSEFTPAEMELVQEVSDRFGLAAENTRLVEESQRVAQRETLINEISNRLHSTNNVESTLAEAARSLSETLQADKVVIRLGIPGDESRTNGQHASNGT